jgi:hypothetical protein
MFNGSVEHVTSWEVINALRDAVCAIGEARLGISKEEFGTHSIRLGAAMAMYLGKCPVHTIMLINQWSSNASLWYIRIQVMEFSHNVSKRILTFQNYHHAPNFDNRVSANNPCIHNYPNNAKTRRNVSGDMSQLMQLPAFSQFSQQQPYPPRPLNLQSSRYNNANALCYCWWWKHLRLPIRDRERGWINYFNH